MVNTIVDVRDFSFKYSSSEKYVLKNINLKLKKGDIAILAGPSGCGKTTLARALIGLIPQFYKGEYEGEIYVCGYKTDITPVSELASCIGYLFQNPENQIIMNTVERDVAFSLEFKGFSREIIKKKVYDILKTLGIEHLADRNIETLSGGEKQLVAIASVLAMEPKALIFDEVSAYLSPRSLKQFIDIIIELNKKQDMSILIIDHRLDLFANLAKIIHIMYDGRILYSGSPKEVFKKMVNRKLGINIPTPVKIYESLVNRGINVTEVPIDYLDLANIILKAIGK